MSDKKISVVIPAYNEENTIQEVINSIKKNCSIHEIIVVDNDSEDLTNKIAKSCNVNVYKCKKRGKGYAMEKGLSKVTGDIVVFLDADLKRCNGNIVNLLSDAIISKNADFVKASFDRKGGRVTELLAKPLIKILYEDKFYFSQPLGGMIAGKVELFRKIKFDKDYGVDIGILLDMIELGVNVQEIHIGKIEHNSKSLSDLSNMAEEVARAILKRKNII